MGGDAYPDVLDLEVVEDEGVAVRPGAEADRGEVLVEADRLGPLRLAVREREDLHHTRSATHAIGGGSRTLHAPCP